MVHRSLYQKIRYDERLQVEDRDFYLKMVSEDLLGFVEYPVAAYRVHETNVSQKGRNDFIGSVNKFKSLTSNINSFSYRDRLLFITPTRFNVVLVTFLIASGSVIIYLAESSPAQSVLVGAIITAVVAVYSFRKLTVLLNARDWLRSKLR